MRARRPMVISDYSSMVIRTVTSRALTSLDVCKDIPGRSAQWTRGRTL